MSKSSSNIIFSNLITYQNIIETLSNLEIINSNYIYNYLYLDYVKDGKINRFIINDIYDGNLTITSNLITSNITTSNLNVIGDTTILNTTLYQTEQLQVINDTTAPSLIIKQLNNNQNVAEFYDNGINPSLIISSNGFIGINKISNINENLDIFGNIKIEGNIYPENDITFDLGSNENKWKNFYTSNIYTSNISINSSNDNPAFHLQQLNEKQNILETYYNNNPAFIISSNGNIAINKEDEGLIEKVEILGNIKIEGNIYPENDITFDLGSNNNKWKNFYTSNIFTSNININSSNNNPAFHLQQLNEKENILETYYNNNPAFIIS